MYSKRDRENASRLLDDEVSSFEQWQAECEAVRRARAKLLLQQLSECYALLEVQEQNVIKLMLRGGQ